MLRTVVMGAVLAGATAPASDELVVAPATVLAVTVDGRAARLRVGSGGLDRLTLDSDYVAANGIKPTWLVGRAQLSVAGRKEFEGRNRPVTMTVAGRSLKTRAFWFPDAPDSGADGQVGPWGLPQPRVTFTLGAAQRGETVTRLPLQGEANSGSYAAVRFDGRPVWLSFAIEDPTAMPVATASLGALIAQEYGGALAGTSWAVEVLMGVRRPVRLLRLDKPLRVGPLRFDQVAVRVRDRIDDSGRGAAIPEAGTIPDPAEVVVTSSAGGPAPSLGLTIPRAALSRCSRLTYDKTAKRIELACVEAS